MTPLEEILVCKRCGACCTDIGTPPFLPDEQPALPQTIRDICEAMYRTYPIRSVEGVPCYFWDPMLGCRIYPYRPSVCRDFEPGGEGCTQHPDGRPTAADMAARGIDHA